MLSPSMRLAGPFVAFSQQTSNGSETLSWSLALMGTPFAVEFDAPIDFPHAAIPPKRSPFGMANYTTIIAMLQGILFGAYTWTTN